MPEKNALKLEVISGRRPSRRFIMNLCHIMPPIPTTFSLTHTFGVRKAVSKPTNIVARDMALDGFGEARTIHNAIFRLKNDVKPWTKNTVLIVDEAAMLETKTLAELLEGAEKTKAKVILIGDDRQLESVGRGGMFGELAARHGAAEISEVIRQSVPWQREAAQHLSQGEIEEAIDLFADNDAVQFGEDTPAAMAALISQWKRDQRARPDATRFAFAYTNKDVTILNRAIRDMQRSLGALKGRDVELETAAGQLPFAAGDRIQITRTDTKKGLINGMFGCCVSVTPDHLELKLDDGETAHIDPTGFEDFDYGYAGTIYKGQGRTLNETYLLHSYHWGERATYVALTRQKDAAHIFAARDATADLDALTRQVSRKDIRRPAVAYSTKDLAP